MTEKELTCNSCKKRITNVTGTVRFMCPNCGKSELVRCKQCREKAIKYECASCNFTGPN